MRIYNYGTLKRLRRGVRLSVVLSYSCNFDCSYCSAKIPNGIYPNSRVEKTLDEWKEFIANFPLRIKEIGVSGGKLFESKICVDFINWLLKKGYFVMLFTNLSNQNRIDELNQSIKLKIIATYHRGQNSWNDFNNNYKRLEKRYTFYVVELGKKTLVYSHLKRWSDIEDMKRMNKNVLLAGPDFRIFTNCYDRVNAYKI